MQSLLLGKRYFAWGKKIKQIARACSNSMALHLIYYLYENRGASIMNYVNANQILPEHLLNEIQKYVQGEMIYIPKQQHSREKWGSKSGGRLLIDERNSEIRHLFKSGKNIEQLAKQYFLSAETIKKIVYSKK